MTDISIDSICAEYNTNKDFHNYVDQYCAKHNTTVIKAFSHELIKSIYIEYKRGEVNVTKD